MYDIYFIFNELLDYIVVFCIWNYYIIVGCFLSK